MLARVSFKNFKSLRSVTLDLSPLTVLVGPNGSGKSSVLQGIELVSKIGLPTWVEDAKKTHFDDLLGVSSHPYRLTSTRNEPTVKFVVHGSNSDSLHFEISLPTNRIGYKISIDGPSGHHEASLPPGESTWDTLSKLVDHPRIQHFTSIVYLHLDATLMVRTSITDEAEPRVAHNGSGLASTLAWLAGAKPETLLKITTALARVVPGVRRILVHRQRTIQREMDRVNIDGQPIWRPVERAILGDRFSVEFDNGTEVPADLLSEGTVLALGLLTKLHEPERPRVLLLDDIDRGLHIGAQAKLVGLLRDLMANDPMLQIVCTTHSTYLLDLFVPSEVRVLDLDADRSTHAKPLTAHQDFDKWKYGTQTGELWAALGDAWVTEQPATQDP